MRALLLFLLFTLNPAQAWSNSEYYVPQKGFITEAETAIRIAIAVLKPIYGNDEVEQQKPFTATLNNEIWYVRSSLSDETLGNIAHVEIAQKDGRILCVNCNK